MFASRAVAQSVLRVGWIKDGRLVEDVTLKAGQSLILGEGKRVTLPVAGLPARALMEWKGGEYVLSLTPEMEGKLEVGGKMQTIAELRAKGSTVSLSVGARGKIVFAEGSLLVQVLPAPVFAAAPRVERGNESLFDGLLLLFSVSATCFSLWIQEQPQREVTVEEVVQSFDVASIKPIEIPVVVKEKVPETAVRRTPAARRPDPAPVAARPGEAGERMGERMGERLGRQIAGLDVEGMLGKDQAILENLGTIRAIGPEGQVDGVRAGPVVQVDDVAYQGPSGLPGRGEHLGVAGPGKIALKPVVKQEEPPQIDGEVDTTGVLKVIRGSRGGVEACTSTALKADPSFHARVSAIWSINHGRVTGVELGTASRNDELNSCILKVVKGMRFDLETTTDRVSYTWVVMGQ